MVVRELHGWMAEQGAAPFKRLEFGAEDDTEPHTILTQRIQVKSTHHARHLENTVELEFIHHLSP